MCLTTGPPPPWVVPSSGGSAPVQGFLPQHPVHINPKDIQGFMPHQQQPMGILPLQSIGQYPRHQQMGLHQRYEEYPYSNGTPGMMAVGVGAPINGTTGIEGAEYPGMYHNQEYQTTPAGGYQYCLPYPDTTSSYYQQTSYQHHHIQQQQKATAILPTKAVPSQSSPSACATSHWWPNGTQDSDRFLKPAPPLAPGQPKRRRRNSEKRKEKSRDAARCRRGKESEIFNELAEMLPLPQATVAQLDKASIMRLALAFLKTRALHDASQKAFGGALSATVLKSEDEEEQESKLDLCEKLAVEDSFMKALDGFVLIICADTEADVVYTSENIQQHLGLPQVDVMGNSLLDYTHACDHTEVKELLAPKGNSLRHCFIRIKCTLTQKGRNVNLKSATYKVCQISGKLVTDEKEKNSWVVATASPVPHPSNIEFPLDKQAFVSKHSLDMKFTYVDENIAEFMGYECEELVGRSLYEMNHAEDSQLLKNIYKILCEKGQVETPRYRFLARSGGYVWMVTQATLINGSKGDNPQYVVCVNYVVSGIESRGEILSSMQLEAATICKPETGIPSPSANRITEISSPCDIPPAAVKLHPHPILPKIEVKTVPKVVIENVSFGPGASPPVAAPVQRQTRPQRSTSKIFTPRTEEMNNGYLVFSKDDPQKTVLKEEPEDLTHLAPCIPTPHEESSQSTPVFSDFGHMFNLECPQQQTSYPMTHSSPVSATSSIYDNSSCAKQNDNNSPFKISYRGNPAVMREKTTSFPIRSTLNILKPISSVIGNKSPIVCTSTGNYPQSSSASLNFQLSNSECDHAKVQPNDASYKSFNSTSVMNMDDEDMEARAPYIPLSDEILMLGPDDLMWGSPNECNSYDSSPNARYSKNPESTGLQENSNLANLLGDIDPTLIGGTGNRKNPSKLIGQPNSRPNQFLEENSFVDPNKVLPVFGEHPVDPRGLLDGYDSGTTVVMSYTDTPPPPPLVGHNDIDTPPPVGSSYRVYNGGHQMNNKRVMSPMNSPVMGHKRICCSMASSPYSQQQRQQQQQYQQQQQQQHGGSVLPLLPVPNAPTMQQLLVSNEPIKVRGGWYDADTCNDAGITGKDQVQGKDTPVVINGKPSVLHNLLVSGQDTTAGYTILIAGSPQIEGANTSITSSSDLNTSNDSVGAKVPPIFTSDDLPSKSQLMGSSHQRSFLIDRRTMIDDPSGRRVFLSQHTDSNHINKSSNDCKGIVDVCSNKELSGVQCKVPQPNQSIVVTKNNISRPQPSAVVLDQHSETKRRLIAMRITQGRTISGGQPVHTPLHLITNCSYNSLNNQDDFKSLRVENNASPRVWRQDLTQLTEPDFSIPSLSELTQQDFEVNAPASTKHLLQGSELIQALDNPF